MSDLLDAALAWHEAGCCVVPARPDGSKAPWSKWKQYQQTRSTPEALESWFSGPHFDGLGLVCGAVSGNLEMFEIEGRAAAAGMGDRLGALMKDNGLEALWRRVTDGYLEQTPSGGFHWLLRVDGDCRPPTKLASNAAGECLIETKGEGGFTIVAPSGGRTHPTGQPWTVRMGIIGSIPTVTVDERDSLYAIATMLDETPAPVEQPREAQRERAAGEVRPGDDYNQRAQWRDILTPHGWAWAYDLTCGRAWRRPDKKIGVSATTGRNDADNLYVFSSSTPFAQGKPYSKFGAYALLEHGGDFSAAARDLAAQGYGSKPMNLYAVPDFEAVPTVEGSMALAPIPQVNPAETLTPEQLAERAHANRVITELYQIRAKHDAKIQHTAELAAKNFRAPAYTRTLTEELLIPDEPVSYFVDELLPTGGNALLAAQFKAGKTTMVTNLLRSYADGDPFLGRFTVTPGEGRIAIFNYELSPNQYRTWLREQGIVNTDRVAVLHLRGHRLPLTVPSVEDWVVNWLIEQECSAWIADPFARAATGTDENSNTEVGVWLDTFDVIKARAGISAAVLPTHTGRAVQEQGQERARGATRLDDWADVRWLLTKDDDENRFFRATGRDVELSEELLTFEPLTRSLTLGGGDRRWVANRALSQRVLDFVNANPGAGVKALQTGVKGNKEQIDAARLDLIRRHKVRVEDGPRSAQFHYANEVEA